MRFPPSCSCIHTTIWMHHMDGNKMHREKAWWELHKNAMSYFEQILEVLTQQNNISKTIQERQTRHAEHCWRNKDELISDWPLHADMPVWADQQEIIYISSVQTQDAVWKTCPEWQLIGMKGERESGKSMLSASFDGDDTYTFIG